MTLKRVLVRRIGKRSSKANQDDAKGKNTFYTPRVSYKHKARIPSKDYENEL